MKIHAALAISLCASSIAYAENSVTLYGLIDEGIGFTNNAGGKQAWQMQSGWLAGNRWGLKGSEDIGGDFSIVFSLENGFDLNSGTLNDGGREFGRQAFVGISSTRYGSLTFGRQYDSITDYLAPLTANGGYAGWALAHPYDNDNTDQTFRINNAVKFSSVNYAGLRFGGLYGFSNQAGEFANNRAFSFGTSYSYAGLSFGAAYLQADNPGGNSVGAISADTNFTARRHQVWGAAAAYSVQSLTLGLAYTHASVRSPTGSIYFGPFGAAPDELKFDNFEVNSVYQITPALVVVGMYTFTQGQFSLGGAKSKPAWHTAGITLDYYISKRTSLYAQLTYQRRTGDDTGAPQLDSAYITAAAGPSSTRTQVLTRIGIMHTF